MDEGTGRKDAIDGGADGRTAGASGKGAIAFEVRDMTCGHCAGTIKRAIEAADAGARIEVDLAQHLVRVVPAGADAAALSAAIRAAGYTPVPA